MKPLAFGLFFLVTLSIASAETPTPQHNATGTAGQATGEARATVKNNFQPKPDEAGLLAKTFQVSDDFIVARFGETGPAALEKIKSTDFKQRDESGISKVLSELFGMKDNSQVKEMIPALLAEKDAVAAGVKEAGGDRYLEETKRLFWAAKYISGESVKTEEAEAFYKFFREDLKAQLAKNADFNKKIADNVAGGGDKEAVKDAVRKEVNQESFKAFLDSMASSKDPKSKKYAADLADTVSFKDANGNKFIDFTKGNETQRLHLGKNSADIEKALVAAAGQPAMVGSKFEPAIVGAPTKQWFQKNGKFESGAPDGFVPPAGTQVGPQVASRTTNDAGPQPKGGARTPGQVDKGKPAKEDVQAFFDMSGSCIKCHGPNAVGTKFRATATGIETLDGKRQITFAQAVGAINANPMMQIAIKDEIKQLEAWRDALGQKL